MPGPRDKAYQGDPDLRALQRAAIMFADAIKLMTEVNLLKDGDLDAAGLVAKACEDQLQETALAFAASLPPRIRARIGR